MKPKIHIVKKVVISILIALLLFYIFYSAFYDNSVKAAESYRYTYDSSSFDSSTYPGYKEKIDALKAAHPNWTFIIMETSLDWEQVIVAETSENNGSPLNLIQGKSDAWICSTCGTKTYDNGTWYHASEMTVRYYMDPRNWLYDNEYLFQFLQIDYVESTDTQIYNALANTFLHDMDYATQINEACKEANVNPYYVVARIIQEQGTGGGSTWKMTDSDGTVYYNLFNVGASGNGTSTIVANALATAKSNGWTSVKSSIIGGVSVLNNYINRKQNTQYLNKFDVEVYEGTYAYQYMQNIEAPKNEASKMYSAMKDANLLDSNLTFIIPVYTNMPSTVSQSPDGVGEIYPKNIRVKEGHTNVNLRASANTTSDVVAVIADSSVILLSVERFDNGWHKVVLVDGKYGYLKFDSSYMEEIDDVTNCSEAMVVTSDSIPMYVGPGSTQTQLTTLAYGQQVTRMDNTGRYTFDGTTWDRIILSDGRQGFVETKYLSYASSAETLTISASGGLYLRSSPAVSDTNKIRLLADGTTVIRTASYPTQVDGYYWDYVTTADGAKGYVARVYLRDSSGSIPGAYSDSSIKQDDTEMMIYVTPSATIETLNNSLGSVTVTKTDGTVVMSGTLRTGDTITLNGSNYTLVKIGDAQGDGEINSADLLRVQKHLLGVKILDTNSVYYKAADANQDGEINSADLLKIQKYLLGVSSLTIN